MAFKRKNKTRNVSNYKITIDQLHKNMSQSFIDEFKTLKKLNEDKNELEINISYLKSVITFDWGYSEVLNEDVSDALRYRFAATLELSILAFIFAVATAIPLGIFSSIRQNRWEDHSIRLFALAGSAIPIFWFALVLQYFFAVTLDAYFPELNWPITSRFDEVLWEIKDPIDMNTNFLLFDAIAAGSWIHFKDA